MKGGSDATDQNEQNSYIQKNQCIWPGKTGWGQSEGEFGSQAYSAMDHYGSPPLASDRRRHDADRPEGSLGGSIDPSTDISKFSKSEREFYKKYGIFKYLFGLGWGGVRPPHDSEPVRP